MQYLKIKYLNSKAHPKYRQSLDFISLCHSSRENGSCLLVEATAGQKFLTVISLKTCYPTFHESQQPFTLSKACVHVVRKSAPSSNRK